METHQSGIIFLNTMPLVGGWLCSYAIYLKMLNSSVGVEGIKGKYGISYRFLCTFWESSHAPSSQIKTFIYEGDCGQDVRSEVPNLGINFENRAGKMCWQIVHGAWRVARRFGWSRLMLLMTELVNLCRGQARDERIRSCTLDLWSYFDYQASK